jgi:ACT domain-containing protein
MLNITIIIDIHAPEWDNIYISHEIPCFDRCRMIILHQIELIVLRIIWLDDPGKILNDKGGFMDKELVFITVIGKDRKGIVATISGFLYKENINIEDINQRIMADGYFVMTMLADIKDAAIKMDQISQDLDKIGNELGMKIQLQHENIFKMMHRV